MRIKHLFYLLAAAPLVFAACNDKPEPEPAKAPEVAITAGTATETSVSFSIDVKNAESAAYLVYDETATTPTSEEIFANGKAVAVNKVSTVSADNLEADTEYTIIAAAIGGGTSVVSNTVRMTTLKAAEPDATTFTLTSLSEMTFTAAGGNGVIEYKLTNPIEGVGVEAECDAEWISDLAAGDTITFVVAANNGEAREATITATYGELTFDVIVKQDEKGEVKPFESFDITFTSASWLMTSPYGDAEVYQFRNDDGFQANVYFEKSLAHPLAPGTYTAADLVTSDQPTFSTSESKVTIIDENGESLKGLYFDGGTITVEIIEGKYKVSFDTNINYNTSTPFKATFEGLFDNDTVWDGNEKPEPTPEYTDWQSAALVSNGGGVIEVSFTDAESNVMSLVFRTLSSYLPAGEYVPAAFGEEGILLTTSSLTIGGEKFIYNTDGANSTANSVVVALDADDTYTFTFNDLTFGSDNLVKGTWSGKIEGLTQTPDEGGDEGGDDDFAQYMATNLHYDSASDRFVFTVDAYDTFYVRMNEADCPNWNTILEGDYTGFGGGTVPEGSFAVFQKIKGGVNEGWSSTDATSTMSVKYVDGEYHILINYVGVWDGDGQVGYKGVPDGWVVPGGGDSGNEGGDSGNVEATELTITQHTTLYSGPDEHHLGFCYADQKYTEIDFAANPITAGTYSLTDSTLIANFCRHEGLMKECTVIVTDNSDGTLTFDATFKAADGNWYHFTYTAAIYS